MSLTRFSRSLLDPFEDDYLITRPFRRSLASPFRESEIGTPSIRDNRYTLRLDYNNFDPNDISVKVEYDTLVVTGKQEKKRDGVVESREYVQKFNVPKNVIADRLTCNLDSNGYLRIEAPIKEEPKDYVSFGRSIPVEVKRW